MKMKIWSVFTLILAVELSIGNVLCDDENETTTTSEPVKDSQSDDASSTTPENVKMEAHQVELMATTEPSTTTYKIPPTLLNTKIDYRYEKSENQESKSPMSGSSLNGLSKTESAIFRPKTGQVIDARVKQAIINSKEQAFKNFNMLNTKVEPNKPSQDQVAKSAEVNSDISKESPKQFLPSPEVSPLYNRENKLQDHFSPMNQYYRSTQQDARFPTDTPFSSARPTLDTRWLGGNRPPSEVLPTRPFEFMQPPQVRESQGRHSNFPFHHREYHNDDRVTFPSDGPPNSNEIRQTWPSVDHKVPALNFKQTKGSWKWIPDDELEFSRNASNYYHSLPDHESKAIPPTQPLLYESYPPYSPPRDHPYSFEQPKGLLSHLFGHHTSQAAPVSEAHYSRYPTGPSGYPSSGSDTFLVTEEYSTQKQEEHPAPTKLPTGDLKHARPTLQQPYLPPNQQFPNQQFPNQQPLNGQVNGPFPLRQRSEHNYESINASLIHFLKTMEAQFQDKQLQSGEKLDGSCEDRFFCEVALSGKLPTADALHQTLYHVALETPNSEARKSGLGEIFAAIKRQSCDVFECEKLL